MKKNHEYYMEEYLCLDKRQHIPFKLTWHFLFCKKCRSQVKNLAKAESLAAKPLSVPLPLKDNTIQEVISKVDKNLSPQKSKNLMPRWVSCGIILLLVMLIWGYLSKGFKNEYYSFFASLLFSIAITAYILFFFANNIDLFVKKIKTKGKKRSPAGA